MSKHGNAEQKLHISPEVQDRQKLPRQKQDNKEADIPMPGPPKGTNANNQYR